LINKRGENEKRKCISDEQMEAIETMDRNRAEEADERNRSRRKILVVGKDDLFTEDMTEYAIQLAGRLKYDILAVNVGTEWDECPVSGQGAQLCERFKRRAVEAGGILGRKAAQSGIHCEHIVKFGRLGKAVEEINHQVKRIEFVVTESEANKEEVTREVTIPVFSVISNSWSRDGGKIMANEYGLKKKKPIGKTVIFGAATVALYAAVFTNTEAVMKYFTKGGWYAALPIATVFLFSFIHGTFSGHVWSLLGIEAVKKDMKQKTEEKVIQQKKRVRPRQRVRAYVNPFHRF
jgi:hypothetical protein